MLKKLMKYELKATARYFLPLYLAILILSLFMGLRGFGGSFLPILDVLLPAILGITFVGLMVMTFILIVTRFDKNLLGDEGYLMFTLPAKASTLISAKLLTAMLWLFATFLVFLLSITFITIRELDIREIFEALRFIDVDPLLVVLFLLVMIVSVVQSILHIYASLSIAQSRSITKNRILGGIIIFILISMVFNVLETAVTFSGGFLMQNTTWFQILIEENYMQDFPAMMEAFKSMFTVLLVYTGAKAVLFYFLTKYHLERKLNLD